MNITRRRFIQNLGTAALAVASLTPANGVFAQISQTDDLFAVPPESFADPLSLQTRAHFEPFVDTFFELQTGEKQIRMRLVEVTDLKREANEKRLFGGESYSLLFEAPRKVRLPQDVYPVRHFALGEFSLLLVPVGIKGNRYEAIINRIAASR
jgi:hypothetical protein